MNKKGFTLIEMLVVIGIIALLMAFLVPTFVTVQDRAKETGVKSVVNQVRLSIESYNLENDTFPVAVSTPLKTLFESYLSVGGYMTKLPKNPFTGKAYSDADTSGKIIYDYDLSKNKYVITGYKKDGTTKLLELTNLD